MMIHDKSLLKEISRHIQKHFQTTRFVALISLKLTICYCQKQNKKPYIYIYIYIYVYGSSEWLILT
jgi:hypothetical protein